MVCLLQMEPGAWLLVSEELQPCLWPLLTERHHAGLQRQGQVASAPVSCEKEKAPCWAAPPLLSAKVLGFPFH